MIIYNKHVLSITSLSKNGLIYLIMFREYFQNSLPLKYKSIDMIINAKFTLEEQCEYFKKTSIFSPE